MSRSCSAHLNHSSISNLKVWTWSWLYNCSYLAQSIRVWLWRAPSSFYCEHIQRHVMCFINSINSSSLTMYHFLFVSFVIFLPSVLEESLPKHHYYCVSISPYHIRCRRTNWLPLGFTPQNIPIKEASYTTFIVELWELFMLFYRLQSPLKSIKILFSLGKSDSGCSCSDIRAMMAWGASSRVKGGSMHV